MHSQRAVTATLTFDPNAFAAGNSPEIEKVLVQVRALLAELRERREVDERVLLTKEQTANVLNISVRTLDTLADLPVVRIGARVLYRREAVIDWCKRHESVVAAV